MPRSSTSSSSPSSTSSLPSNSGFSSQGHFQQRLPTTVPNVHATFLPPSTPILFSSSKPNQDQTSSLEDKINDLEHQLVLRDRHIRMLENSSETADDILEEWQGKYDRLWDSHRKLQKTNQSLEEKLLKVVDKFDADKNQMARDLASQTQKLVQAKLTIQQLHDQNSELQSDLHLAITLLQNRPSSYLAQRVDSLPSDMQARVRSCIAEKSSGSEAKKILVPVEGKGDDEKVSAAILAKVLEERSKERKKESKFCIDIGTQTHGWHFPEKLSQNKTAQTIETASSNPNVSRRSAFSIKPSSSASLSANDVVSRMMLKSISLDMDKDQKQPWVIEEEDKSGALNTILLRNVVRNPNEDPRKTSVTRSQTCSTLQTEI